MSLYTAVRSKPSSRYVEYKGFKICAYQGKLQPRQAKLGAGQRCYFNMQPSVGINHVQQTGTLDRLKHSVETCCAHYIILQHFQNANVILITVYLICTIGVSLAYYRFDNLSSTRSYTYQQYHVLILYIIVFKRQKKG